MIGRERASFGTVQQSPGNHADIILLVRVSANGTARVLEIPRDLLVELPDGAPVRLTLTLAFGPQGPVTALCQTLGVGVDHVAVIHFDGFEDIVNAVGGVTVDIPAPLRDSVLHLVIDRSGPNLLDGGKALALIRARSIQSLQDGSWIPDPPSANERSEWAATILEALAQRIQPSISSPLGTLRRVWALAGAVSLSNGTDLPDMLKLAAAVRNNAISPASQLDVAFHDGAVPTAELLSQNMAILRAFNGGMTARCRFRPIPPPEGA